MKRPTMGDVAARADVSKTTVSHVINNTRHVEEDTKRRVLQAIDELDYRPSAAARSLTTNRTETIGVIVSDSSNYFFAEVLRGIEDVLRLENYALLVCNTAEILEREEHYLDILIRQRVDGIIAAATSRKWGTLSQVEALHIPIVFVDRLFEGLNAPYVGVDNKEGAGLGASYLVGCGYTEIGIYVDDITIADATGAILTDGLEDGSAAWTLEGFERTIGLVTCDWEVNFINPVYKRDRFFRYEFEQAVMVDEEDRFRATTTLDTSKLNGDRVTVIVNNRAGGNAPLIAREILQAFRSRGG